MAIRNILRDGDPSLLKKSRVVVDFNKRLHTLLDDMHETLHEANGLGLAAPQVGVLRRVALIVDMDSDENEERVIELINPEILEVSEEDTDTEGCLSVPGVYGIVSRPLTVKVRAQDRYGKPFELLAEKVTARAVCHEVDHLNGIIFTTLAERFLSEEEISEMFAKNTAQDEDSDPENETEQREEE